MEKSGCVLEGAKGLSLLLLATGQTIVSHPSFFSFPPTIHPHSVFSFLSGGKSSKRKLSPLSLLFFFFFSFFAFLSFHPALARSTRRTRHTISSLLLCLFSHVVQPQSLSPSCVIFFVILVVEYLNNKTMAFPYLASSDIYDFVSIEPSLMIQ